MMKSCISKTKQPRLITSRGIHKFKVFLFSSLNHKYNNQQNS